MHSRSRPENPVGALACIVLSLLVLSLATGCTFRPRNVRLIMEGDGILVEPVAQAEGGAVIHALRPAPEIGRVRYMDQPVRLTVIRRPKSAIGTAKAAVRTPQKLAGYQACGPMQDGEAE